MVNTEAIPIPLPTIQQWGAITIAAGSLTGESPLPIAYTSFYRATATHIALDGQDDFGINVGNLTKLIVQKTYSGSGTFTLAYLTMGV